MRRVSSFPALGKLLDLLLPMAKANRICSAKELDHFERIRRTFESVDKQKQDQSTGPQTIEDALEALSVGNQVDGVGVVDGPVVNGDGDYPPAASKGKGKHGMTRTMSSHSAGGKGKGKTSSAGAGSKLKNKPVASADDESDSSFENHKSGMKNGRGSARKYVDVGEEDDGAEVDGDDEYVVRTEHLK